MYSLIAKEFHLLILAFPVGLDASSEAMCERDQELALRHIRTYSVPAIDLESPRVVSLARSCMRSSVPESCRPEFSFLREHDDMVVGGR